jgi:endoglucanase
MGVLALLLLVCPVKAGQLSNDGHTPAHEAAKRFRRGVNFGNFLEAPPAPSWSIRHTTHDLALASAEGFDHVRLPVGWHYYAGPAPDFQLSGDIFARVDDLVTNAAGLGLGVIINIHNFDAFTRDPVATTPEFQAIWRQVAAHYSKAPSGVAFELLNEPKDAATTDILNPIYAETIRLIRQNNPQRTIFIGPGRWNSVNELDRLHLPEEDLNLIVTVHCYEPFYFTHQGATWAGADTKVIGIRFPGPPMEPLVPAANLQLNPWVRDWIRRYNELPADRNPCSEQAFRAVIQKAKAWSERSGRPVHFGEFGCYTKADPESRIRFYAAFRQALDEAGLGWAIWDWKAGFRYWDARRNEPVPGMRQALFPHKSQPAANPRPGSPP